jgi:Ca2+-binding EF-hand superfamily protein
MAGYLKHLRPEIDAQKMESLSSLLEMFDLEGNGKIDKEIELEHIIEELKKNYRKIEF